MLHVLWSVVTGLTNFMAKELSISIPEMREGLQQTMLLESESPEMAAMYEQVIDQFFEPLMPPRA